MAKIKKIRKIIKDTYLDNSEDFLLEFFDEPEDKKTETIDSLLGKSDLPWALRYHLSPQRHMILKWYPFESQSSLLEVGAGCGAVTGLFLDKMKKVTCNELSPSRANVIKKRFIDKQSLDIYTGNINDMKKDVTFDYVTLIGVLEYAARYSESNDPYLELLNTINNLLSKDGHLLIAIENKIGLKYISGAPEDHLGTPYTSLENYPQNQGIKTFTKSELTEMLKVSGYNKIDFYYPFPDYKLPKIVFSEDGIKSMNNLTKSTITQTVDLSTKISQQFNEVAFSHLLDKEKILSQFSNSFLVDAKK